MAKIQHVDHRLERWALWRVRGGTLAGGTSSLAMWANVKVDGQQPPTFEALLASSLDEGECAATEQCIMALPDPLGMTVSLYYLVDSSRTQAKLSISAAVLCQRIDRAHKLLDVAFRKPASAQAGELQSWTKKVAQP